MRFFVQDASDPGLEGTYDLVTIFEALHDMARPVEALRTARGLLAEGGSVIVGDEKVAESFTVPGDELERLNYGFSVLHCLAVGREDEHSAATGTVIRPHTVDEYARDAGFARGRGPADRARLLALLPPPADAPEPAQDGLGGRLSRSGASAAAGSGAGSGPGSGAGTTSTTPMSTL